MVPVPVEVLKQAVVQMMQIVFVEIGVYFLGNTMTPPLQGALSLDPECSAPYAYYQTIAELHTYGASAIVFAALLLCGLKLYLVKLGEIPASLLPKWKTYLIRIVLVLAVVASATASTLAAAIFYNLVLVKVGLDRDHCMPGALKPLIIVVYGVVGAAGLLVHGFIASVAFN